MTERDWLMFFFFAWSIGLGCLCYAFGWFEGKITASQKFIRDTRRDTDLLRQLFPER